METPDFDRVYETFIKIGLPNEVSLRDLTNVIRVQIMPLIDRLRNGRMINWYFFLIHDKDNGVPTTEDDHNWYYHLRFGLERNVNPDDFLDVLSDYCEMITPRRVTNSRILGINPSVLKNDRYEEAWKVMGEQSEWIINVLSAHKHDIGEADYYRHIGQLMHYYYNMLALSLSVPCPNCKQTMDVKL